MAMFDDARRQTGDVPERSYAIDYSGERLPWRTVIGGVAAGAAVIMLARYGSSRERPFASINSVARAHRPCRYVSGHVRRQIRSSRLL